MKHKLFVSLLMLCLLFTKGRSQNDKRFEVERKWLKIGDKLPDLPIDELIKYKTTFAKTSDFRGKWLILDFWGVNCKACIASMPKLDSLQDMFKDKLQILMVTKDSREKVTKLAGKQKLVNNCRIPSVVGDTVLSPLFPLKSFPSHVWIDPEGVIRFITDGWNTNQWTISQTLRGVRVPLSEKNESVDWNAVGLGSSQKKAVKPGEHLSWFDGKVFGVEATSIREISDPETKHIVGLKAVNIPIQKLITDVYRNIIAVSNDIIGHSNRIIVENDTMNLLNGPGKDDQVKYNKWMQETKCSYELYMPGVSRNELYKKAAEDIEKKWRYRGSVEKRLVRCMALVKKGADSLILTKQVGQPMIQFGRPIDLEPVEGRLRLKNQPIRNLVSLLQLFNKATPPPIVDATGISCGVDMDIEFGPLVPLERIKEQLIQYGLFFEEREIWIDMFVIRYLGNKI